VVYFCYALDISVVNTAESVHTGRCSEYSVGSPCGVRIDGHGARLLAPQTGVPLQYEYGCVLATRSRAPNGPPRNQHRAGYRSRICLDKRRNTNLARETRTICPVGRTSLSPWVWHQSYWVRCYLTIPPRHPPPMCKSRVFVECHTAAPYKKPRKRYPTTRVF
jgi:hypothetical protein